MGWVELLLSERLMNVLAYYIQLLPLLQAVLDVAYLMARLRCS